MKPKGGVGKLLSKVIERRDIEMRSDEVGRRDFLKMFPVGLFLCFLAAGSSIAAEKDFRCRSIEAVRASLPPKIDGILDDPCWEKAPVAKPFIDSYTSKPAQDQTEAYVLYDEKALYVAFKCFDSRPDQIVARETKRDGNPWGDDFVEVAVDPFKIGQFQGRNVFKVNAIGTQFTEIRGGRAEKTEWKGDWEAAVSRTDFGWTAEMSIPWDIMDHPSPKKPITIGINFGRYQPRTSTFSFWSDLGWPFHHEWNGYLVGVLLPKSRVKSLRALFYLLGGTEPQQRVLRGGLDIRYRPNPQASLLFTANPDFSNVEQEVETIDFSYLPRAYSDRRPFFQEGGEMFGLGGGDFYSRNIGRIDGGLKLYSRVGRTSFGVMDCMDIGDWNVFIATIGRDVGRASSLKGYIVRKDDKDGCDQVIALKGNGRFFEKLYMSAEWHGNMKEGGNGSSGSAYIGWNGKNVGMGLSLSYLSPGYKPALGLVGVEPMKGGNFGISYSERWGSGESTRFFYIGSSIGDTRYYEGGHYMSGIRSYLSFSLNRRGTESYWCSLSFNSSSYKNFNDNYVQIGSGLSWKYKDLFSIEIESGGSYGRRQEKRYIFLNPSIDMSIGRNIFLVRYYYEFLQHGERKEQHVVWLNFNITPEHGIGSRFVWREGRWNWYFSYRQGVRKGTDAYLIVGDPNAQEFQKRAFLKLVAPMW
jgi:hypothetical protein